MNAISLLYKILSVSDIEKAKFLQKYFKTKKGDYAEGDIMLGLSVPMVRDIVKKSPNFPFSEIQILLDSKYHEVRLAGLLFLVKQFKETKKEEERKKIFNFYLKNIHRINNWDLVDITCRDVIGSYLLNKEDRDVLYKLCRSNNLWEQRIAIVSTWTFIKNQQFDDTLAISEKLLNHQHDLIHKAVGWMLREVSKRNYPIIVSFLEKNYKRMPRTMLRYAIKHFSPEEKTHFLKKVTKLF
ncbi:MAG: DNA alkylation repair protein [Candidatus Azobacteroides pseudotrichonymphae]|jgi:3-methyladenine DNA glycosylase AlkD|uniref:DNA alkylation repair enzyme n=1 Tax=Azobacteroides pseudotrichonymphae genomovar. CFP2 TaxID=511995 RepID=B6YR83_AZOPC|nr:DNA alkylation repair protein [Candidatus Azobacteroides pseudotrichonymphae]MDR0530094.1 DNA alkylation repair protein [Bacteroidales bacterium OttesenSCG-928-I14]BAG83705.1 putative DNA alkylation repair enzyme [Candidatus Azobacteroides pseudotrichonymphae genomovar. CFP2]GMO34734.1 MAG: DNA alkylation repair protein [Candidatus Azobacteroides pseudotrichonymphae]